MRQGNGASGRVRPSRGELTVAGKVTLTFLAIAFGIALLHGSNPVLFIVSCIAATLLLSLLLTWVSTGALALERELPARVFTGAPFDVRLRVTNRSRWRPALGLRFKDGLQISRPGELTCGPTLPVLPPKGTAEVSYRRRIQRRGVYEVIHAVAATTFPFGLFERSVVLRSGPSRLIVLPALGRLGRAGRRDLAARLAQPREARLSVEGREEFHSLRDYRPGDSLRLVHWKTSARAGTLMRRVMQDESGEDLNILLDTRVEGLHEQVRERSLEKAVSCAATLLAEAARRGRRAVVYTHGGEARHHGVLQGIVPALEKLARIEASEAALADLVSRAPLRRASRALALSLFGAAPAARKAAAARGVALSVWDVSHPDFEKVFRKR